MAKIHGSECYICCPPERTLRFKTARRFEMDPEEQREFKDAKRIATSDLTEVSHVQVLFARATAERWPSAAMPPMLAT